MEHINNKTNNKEIKKNPYYEYNHKYYLIYILSWMTAVAWNDYLKRAFGQKKSYLQYTIIITLILIFMILF